MSYVSASSTASSTAPTPRFSRSGDGGFYAVVSLLLGLLVGVLALVAVFMWIDAHDAKNSANRAAAKAGSTAMPGMEMSTPTQATAGGLESFAGAAPANAAALAAAHKPYPAALPAPRLGRSPTSISCSRT